MKIAVIGAGAIGSLVAGYLKLKGQEVVLIGRKDAVDAINSDGLRISGALGEHTVRVEAARSLRQEPDLAILCTKTQDIEAAIQEHLLMLRGSTILTTQNGIRAEEIIARHILKEKIISSIVMFGATYVQPGKVVHNFEGSWVLGSIFGGATEDSLAEWCALLEAVARTLFTENILAMKYVKVFVNANNCIPGILGVSMQEAFLDKEISKIGIGIWKEGFELVSRADIKLVSLPGFPVENITKLTALPSAQAADIFSGIMTKLSKDPVYGSILQSIMRGRVSEVEYINGEFVRLAKARGSVAPLNEKLVKMVHEVERTGHFLSKEQLLNEVKSLVGM